jgi:hypothetical protein
MSNKKYDNKEHFSARISPFLVQKMKEKSQAEGRSVTSVVEDAFLQYFQDELPGLCRSCRWMNDPQSRFCNRCGKPLVEEAWPEYFTNFEEFWKNDDYLDKIEKMLKDRSNNTTPHPD